MIKQLIGDGAYFTAGTLCFMAAFVLTLPLIWIEEREKRLIKESWEDGESE